MRSPCARVRAFLRPGRRDERGRVEARCLRSELGFPHYSWLRTRLSWFRSGSGFVCLASRSACWAERRAWFDSGCLRSVTACLRGAQSGAHATRGHTRARVKLRSRGCSTVKLPAACLRTCGVASPSPRDQRDPVAPGSKFLQVARALAEAARCAFHCVSLGCFAPRDVDSRRGIAWSRVQARALGRVAVGWLEPFCGRGPSSCCVACL